MKQLPVIHRAMDLTLSRRVFTVCWLSAGLGISTLQMLLLAQGWYLSRQALLTALLASAWALGSFAGTRFSGSARLRGSGCLACVLLWLGHPLLVAWYVPHTLHLSPVLLGNMLLALLAVLLGTCSAAWLAQQRPWPSAGEKTILVRSLVGLTIGLLVAWILPAVGGFIALACCLPLLLLDVFLSSRTPLHPAGSIAARWMDRYWNMEGWSMQLERRGLLRDWSGLFQRGRPGSARDTLPLFWLASAVTVLIAGVWGAVPTPFAAKLSEAHALDVLYWLFGGQIVALAVGSGFLLAARNGIGFPGRLLPLSWRSRARKLALLMLLAMAASLVALGVPALQARWWLALSLAGYTLADAVWSILLPRLLPDLTTVVQSQRHRLLGRDARLTHPLHLGYRRACEASAKRVLARGEGLAIVVWTPLLGWLIDRLNSVDAVLVLVGLIFALGLLCTALVWALIALAHRLVQRHPVPGSRSLRVSSGLSPGLDTAVTH